MIGLGSVVGNYRVEEKIGHGAMGIVYRALHPSIGRRVALKVIVPELAASEEVVSRFFNEARAATQIGHPHIVEVLDFGQTPEGESFMIMELLEGESLTDRLRREGPQPVARALHIAAQIADGLGAAHARGIIHRDLKPDNVMLVARPGDPDFVKILDFGLAKLTGPGSLGHKTKTGSLLGTPHYMAPEQVEAKGIDPRADVYALGCMLFELLTGRVPFPGVGYGEVLVKQLREPPPLPSRLNPSVPAPVERVVLHALAKKPDFRFSSMDAFRAALRDPGRFAGQLEEELASGASVTLVDPVEPVFLPSASPASAPARSAAPVIPKVVPRVGPDARTLLAEEAPAVTASPVVRSPSSPSVQAVRTTAQSAPSTLFSDAELAAIAPMARTWRWLRLLGGVAIAGVAIGVLAARGCAKDRTAAGPAASSEAASAAATQGAATGAPTPVPPATPAAAAATAALPRPIAAAPAAPPPAPEHPSPRADPAPAKPAAVPPAGARGAARPASPRPAKGGRSHVDRTDEDMHLLSPTF